MKFYSRKIATIGIIVALASLAGWFCVNLQGMQMPEDFSSMAMSATLSDAGVHYMEVDGALHNTWSACVFNCLSKSPLVVIVKKFNVDLSAGFLVSIAAITHPPARNASLASASSRSDAGGPVPDILSSVFKKE